MLDELAAVLGHPLAVDANGECGLAFDDDVRIVVAEAADPNVLTIRAALTTASQAADADTLHKALAINHAHLPPGYAVSLDEAAGQIMLMAVLWAPQLSREQFLDFVEGFVTLVPELRGQLGAAISMTPTDSMLMQRFGA